jgi:hypothetical protein
MALKLALGIIPTRLLPRCVVPSAFPTSFRHLSATAPSGGSDGFIKVELDESSGNIVGDDLLSCLAV